MFVDQEQHTTPAHNPVEKMTLMMKNSRLQSEQVSERHTVTPILHPITMTMILMCSLS